MNINLSYKRGNSGLTLIEITVVIGILGLLMIALGPALSRTREQGERTQCMNNLRQIFLAWAMYCHDENDRMPPNVDGMFGGFTNWVAGNMAFPSDASD